jgi:hypothetical protein
VKEEREIMEPCESCGAVSRTQDYVDMNPNHEALRMCADCAEREYGLEAVMMADPEMFLSWALANSLGVDSYGSDRGNLAMELIEDNLREVQSFEDAGLLTRDQGLVLRMIDGTSFQVTIQHVRNSGW